MNLDFLIIDSGRKSLPTGLEGDLGALDCHARSEVWDISAISALRDHAPDAVVVRGMESRSDYESCLAVPHKNLGSVGASGVIVTEHNQGYRFSSSVRDTAEPAQSMPRAISPELDRFSPWKKATNLALTTMMKNGVPENA